ncbi:Orexin receptor type 2 [Schistosoma japonicum]|uniref:Orexin receptor type 2 n=1 Tax=Schistosoma japonicum TaxID=6182 RepID=A0A4Z2DE63_SCHJA|nr:Orexin receptor type 2 [Schistosoma japonicum]TNN14461.1 Orexin receptor type 2 [Schistosoma japonicum]
MSLMTADLSNQIPTVLIMLGIICFIGIFGNILVIIVYSLKHDRLTATLFILVLASSDLLACVTLIPGTMIIEYLEWNIDSTFLCKFYYFINNTFIPFSSLLISCIAFDRYFCLCHPFKNILTRQKAKYVILILIFICSILGFSSTFTVRVEQVNFDNKFNNNNNNVTIVHNSTITLYIENKDYIINSYYKNAKFECTEIMKLNHTMIERVLYQIVQKSQTSSYILCILCVVTLYILIYRSVSKVFKKRLELKGVKRGNEKPTDNTTQYNKQNNNKFNLRNHFNFRSTKHSSPVKLIVTNQENTIHYSENTTNNNNLSSSLKCIETTKNLPFISYNTNKIKSTEQSTNLKETQQQQQNHLKQQSIRSNSSISINGSNLMNTQHLDSVINQPIALNYQHCLMTNEEKYRRSMKTIKDNIAFQNLKTAAMLFVVAVVYIVTFIPAMLMAIQYVPLYLPIFYLYYINNAINPIIYGFMNPNFRADIHLLICQKFQCIQ